MKISLRYSAEEEREFYQNRIADLEAALQDLVHQEALIDKWNVLQNYVLVAAELERVSLAVYDLQHDNQKLAETC